jgi:hypothetical protein
MIWLARLWLIDRAIDLRHAWRALRRLVVSGRP